MNEKKNRTSNGYKPNATKTEIITCRRILNVIIFIGFMVNYMLRVNLNFAIVDMVAKQPQAASTNNAVVTPAISDGPVLNRSVRSANEFTTENSLRRLQVSLFQQLKQITNDEDSHDQPKNLQVNISKPLELDDVDDNEVEGEDSNIFPIRHDKPNSVSSRNLIFGKNEYSDLTNLTSPSLSTNTTNVDTMDSVLNGTAILGAILEIDRVKRFNWSEAQQGYLIGSFFWGYVCSELPGGRLAEIYGPRKVFGYATLGATVFTLLTPLAAKIHFVALILCRILLGFCLGPTWPSVLPLAAKWIPPDERGKFLSNMMASTLGAGITLPICGFIIATLSWEYVFYICGLVSFLWCIIWFMFVYDSPACHPRISQNERRYIESKLGVISLTADTEENQVVQRLMADRENAKDFSYSDQSDAEGGSPNKNDIGSEYCDVMKKNCNECSNGKYNKKYELTSDGEMFALQPVTSHTQQIRQLSLDTPKNNKADIKQSNSARRNAPWLHIITSVPVWAFVLTHASSVFGYFTITNQLPTYMKYILHYNIKENGILSGLPNIAKYLSALTGGSVADYLLKSSILPRHIVRKLFTIIGVMVPGFMMIIQVFVGSDKVVSVIIFILTLTANGFVTGGYLGNSLELASNYSGTIFGLANMFSGFAGTLSALLVGYLTDNQQVYEQWQKVFAILAVVFISGSSIFLIFGSTEEQPWNSEDESRVIKAEINGADNT